MSEINEHFYLLFRNYQTLMFADLAYECMICMIQFIDSSVDQQWCNCTTAWSVNGTVFTASNGREYITMSQSLVQLNTKPICWIWSLQFWNELFPNLSIELDEDIEISSIKLLFWT